MDHLFIPIFSKQEIPEKLIKEASMKLPLHIALVYSIQYKSQAENIKKSLTKQKITDMQQVLGCSKPKFPDQTQAILLISDGKFHAVSLAYETKLPVFILNSSTFNKVPEEEIKKMEKRQKASYLKFLNEENAGILVSTKPGQERLSQALELKKSLNGKKVYLFLSNNINTQEFENFPINIWVNTACTRMTYDNSNIINIGELDPRNSK